MRKISLKLNQLSLLILLSVIMTPNAIGLTINVNNLINSVTQPLLPQVNLAIPNVNISIARMGINNTVARLNSINIINVSNVTMPFMASSVSNNLIFAPLENTYRVVDIISSPTKKFSRRQ